MNEDISNHQLSRRERQLIDAVISYGEATASQVRDSIPDAPTDAAVRRMLAILEEKGYLTHRKKGRSFLYSLTLDFEAVRDSALDHLKKTYFRGSSFKAVATMLNLSQGDLNSEELNELSKMIQEAKEKGKD